MSFMRGDLLTKTKRLVKGLAQAKPRWLEAMEEAPPPVFPRHEGKVPKIVVPEAKYIKKFYDKHPDAVTEEAFWFNGFNPPPARVSAWRQMDLINEGLGEEEAFAIADMEYKAEKRARKKAYVRLKQIARLQGKKPLPNPYPSAIKEIQAEEKKFVHERFTNPKILELVEKMKEERKGNMQQRERFRR